MLPTTRATLIIFGVISLLMYFGLTRSPSPQDDKPTRTSTKYADGSVTQCKLLQPDVPSLITSLVKIPPRPTHFPKSCKKIAADLLAVQPPTAPGPSEIPTELYNDYTFNRSVPVSLEHQYQKYAGGTAETPVWTMEQINEMREKARKKIGYGNYPHDVHYIYAMMDKWGLDAVWGKKGIVLGSENPWLEAILLEWGASQIITIEYGKISSLHPQISTLIPAQNYKRLIEDEWEPVDWAFSFSSIEHSGLGRYGDPLNPFGDFEAMEQIACNLKPGGILFLGVPVAADWLVFNLHRIYGPRRLARMFEGWRLLDMHGVTEKDFQIQGRADNQPVIVLQNYRGCAH